MLRTKRVIAFLCTLLMVAMLFQPVALADGVEKSGLIYNENDYNKLVAFFAQSSATAGKTNGELHGFTDDPATWTGVTWTGHTEKRIEAVDWEEYGFSGSLDLSNMTFLLNVNCGSNEITSLDVTGCTALWNLQFDNNMLSAIDVSENTALEVLICSENNLSSLDVSQNGSLKGLLCVKNSLTELDLSNNPLLMELFCSQNQLASLEVNDLALTILECVDNDITSLDVSNNTTLRWLICSQNKLTTLDVSGCTALESLYCDNNNLSALDLSSNIALVELVCKNNQLTLLDVENCTQLQQLACYNNQLANLDITKNVSLINIQAFANHIIASIEDGHIDLSAEIDDFLVGLEYNNNEGALNAYGVVVDGLTVEWKDATGNTVSTDWIYPLTPGQDYTLTAHFSYSLPNVTVYFNSNGGSAVPSQTIKSGEKLTKPADPTKSGYTFAGWYKNEALTNAWDFNTDTVPDNLTLFAKWTANSIPGDSLNITPPVNIVGDITSGASVSGAIPAGAVLTVGELSLPEPGANTAADIIRKEMGRADAVVLFAKDIKLSQSYSGKLILTLPIDAKYNGQTVTILHDNNGKLERYTAVVKDGKVTIEITSLSPFVILLQKSTLNVPNTGDASNLGILVFMCFLAAANVLLLCVVRIKTAKR